MDSKKKKKSNFWKRWRATYRFVIFHDETFEERFSYKLNRLNVFLVISISVVFLIAATFLVISQTQLKEYIPGYDTTEMRLTAVKNIETLDSLENIIKKNQAFLNSIGSVILGEVFQL